MISAYILTWKIVLASWQKDWKKRANAIDQLDKHHFQKVPFVHTLVWNVVISCLLMMWNVHAVGLSQEFCGHIFRTMVVPMITVSLAFYQYRFGASQIYTWETLKSFIPWCQNAWSMFGMSAVSVSQSLLVYGFGFLLEPLLPEWMRYSLVFPNDMIEESMKLSIRVHWALFVLLTLTLPLWVKGYHISMEVAGRNARMTPQEAFLECLFLVSQSSQVPVASTAGLLIFQNVFGLRLHLVHFIIAVSEIMCINYFATLKFDVLHEIMHKVQPLYQLTHVEHHICKGTFPCGQPAGLFETYYAAGAPIFSAVFVYAIPYLFLQTVFCGVHCMVHTMWPHPKLLQYHTLHHTINADMYAANVPSSYDKANSRTFAQLHKKLCQTSPFCRYEPLSDMVGAVFMLLFGLFLHYGLETGITKMDWSRVEWTPSYY
jgi:hypothetical protein